jgi:tetracycline resistance efflux pump
MEYLTLLPPVLTITLALLTKEVYSSLLMGIISGVFIIHGFSIDSLQLFLDKYLIESLGNSDNVKVIIFSMCIGGIAQLINDNGGIEGVVKFIERKERSSKQIQF